MIQPIRDVERIDAAATFVPIDRPRLLRYVASAATRPVTLIVAPAGYGKTVVMRQFLNTLGPPLVRFDLGAEHGSLLGFVRGLSEALAGVAPYLRSSLAGAYERNAASASRADELANWTHAHLEPYCGVIAIDDLHVTERDPDVARFVETLIERSKGRVRWILASRSRAGLPVERWMAYDDCVLEIDERDLRFTAEEAAVAARAFGFSVGDAELAALYDLTAGWPLALSFALRNVLRARDLRSAASSTREVIYRYLAEHVYRELTEEECDLLDVVSALPRIEVSLLEAAGFDRAYAVLERIAERTAFLTKEPPRTYRCHDLFRDFLRHQLALRGSAAQKCVYVRAAQALERNGEIEHAIEAYAKAKARDAVLRLLERHGMELFERARGDVVERGIAALDERTRTDNARILVLRGRLQSVSGRLNRAEALLRRAIEKASSDAEAEANARFALALLLINSDRDADEILVPVAEDDALSFDTRALAYSLIATRQTDDRALVVRGAIERANELLPLVADDGARLQILHRIGLALAAAGDSERGVALLQEALRAAEELHHYSRGAMIHVSLAVFRRHEDDDLTAGAHHARRALEQATKAGDIFVMEAALLELSTIEMRRGDHISSEAIEERLAPLLGRDPRRVCYLNPARAVRSAWFGRFGEAHALLEDCWMRFHFDADRVICGSYCALFLAADGARERSASVVRDVLTEIAKLSERGIYRKRSRVNALALCALAEILNGRKTNAHRIRSSIYRKNDRLALSAVAFIDACLSDADVASTPALDAFSVALTAAGYVDVCRVLRAVSDRGARAQAGQNAALTLTEKEILSLLAGGMRPKEIAFSKGRSVYTIQSHIARAIQKLGCQGRIEAIARARRQGLIT